MWVDPKGANSIATSELGCRNDLVDTGRSFLAEMELETSNLTL